MKHSKHYFSILDLFQKYISDTSSGRRLQKNGKRIAKSTLENYKALQVNLYRFSQIKGEAFMVNIQYRNSKRLFDAEKRRYARFYKDFTEYLYKNGCSITIQGC